MKKIIVWLTNKTYRELLKRRRLLRKRDRVLGDTYDRTVELLLRDPEHTHIKKSHLCNLQNELRPEINDNLQELNEVEKEIANILGISECDL